MTVFISPQTATAFFLGVTVTLSLLAAVKALRQRDTYDTILPATFAVLTAMASAEQVISLLRMGAAQ